MRAIILSIGDELVLGQVVDTNAAWLSEKLVEQGIMPEYHQAVPDNLKAISAALKLAAGKADLVIVSGGLGPTPDDLTRQAIAAAAGVKLVLHKPSLGKLKVFFKERGRIMSENNRLQAMFPEGAAILENPIGTAPGFSIILEKATITVMPGVPKEMKLMFTRHIGPIITAKSRSKMMAFKLNAFGPGESVVAEKLGKIMRRERNPLVGTTVSGGIISIRIRGKFNDEKKGAREPALPEMRKTTDKIKRLLGDVVFSEGDVSLAEVVGRMLLASRKTVVTAESCTAGLLAAMLTELPGASAYFLGGWVVYSNKMKTENLAVPEDLIAREGAVSELVARKMAAGALARSGADYALALTGIAGPEGGSPQKPVGTVWIALARRKKQGTDVYVERKIFMGDRALIRERAAKTALNILRLSLMPAGGYIAAEKREKRNKNSTEGENC
ncbi:MAG: competence/damage-inducible protein A [Kiritimatiellia bacterium]|nr:competence/damage-inducible protein A [Kiritimatiellia bacterium]